MILILISNEFKKARDIINLASNSLILTKLRVESIMHDQQKTVLNNALDTLFIDYMGYATTSSMSYIEKLDDLELKYNSMLEDCSYSLNEDIYDPKQVKMSLDNRKQLYQIYSTIMPKLLELQSLYVFESDARNQTFYDIAMQTLYP